MFETTHLDKLVDKLRPSKQILLAVKRLRAQVGHHSELVFLQRTSNVIGASTPGSQSSFSAAGNGLVPVETLGLGEHRIAIHLQNILHRLLIVVHLAHHVDTAGSPRGKERPQPVEHIRVAVAK